MKTSHLRYLFVIVPDHYPKTLTGKTFYWALKTRTIKNPKDRYPTLLPILILHWWDGKKGQDDFPPLTGYHFWDHLATSYKTQLQTSCTEERSDREVHETDHAVAWGSVYQRLWNITVWIWILAKLCMIKIHELFYAFVFHICKIGALVVLTSQDCHGRLIT